MPNISEFGFKQTILDNGLDDDLLQRAKALLDASSVSTYAASVFVLTNGLVKTQRSCCSSGRNINYVAALRAIVEHTDRIKAKGDAQDKANID